MVTARAACALVVLAGLGGAACDTDLDPRLEGLACRATTPQCLPGYSCNPDNRCVRDVGASGAGGSSGGAGGSGGSDAAGGNVSVGGSNDGTAGNGNTVPDAGDDEFRYDAGPGLDALDASVLPDAGGCDAPVTLFRDEDEDGFGVTSQAVRGCPAPQWAPEGGDCRDDLPDVHPRQQEFFTTGYPDPTRPAAGNISFDYDCNISEEPAPGVVPAPACAGDLLTCTGSGYAAAVPARSGFGVNGICGSTQIVVCQSTAVPLLGLTCSGAPVDNAAPAACR